jgi:hypothetical protein
MINENYAEERKKIKENYEASKILVEKEPIRNFINNTNFNLNIYDVENTSKLIFKKSNIDKLNKNNKKEFGCIIENNNNNINHKDNNNHNHIKNLIEISKKNYRDFYTFKNLSNENDLKNNKKYRLVLKENSKYNRLCKIKTFRDFDSLNPLEAIKFDKRPFVWVFWCILVKENPILNLVFYESILEPLWIRCINFYFSLSLLFFMNALFFTDDEIDKRSDQPKEVRVKN